MPQPLGIQSPSKPIQPSIGWIICDGRIRIETFLQKCRQILGHRIDLWVDERIRESHESDWMLVEQLLVVVLEPQ